MATRIPLLLGAYSARSIIAAAQRCLNLYPEKNPQGEDSPTTLYLTPGLSRLGFPLGAQCRGLYRATNGQLFACAGSIVFYITESFDAFILGAINDGLTPVKMGDNGAVMVIVDGSPEGWQVNLSNLAFAPITDPNFFGSNFVETLDTFLIFNKPGSNILYCSPSNYIGSIGASDLVIGAANIVSAPSHAFGPATVGQVLAITGGTGFTSAVYTIDSVLSGSATLSTSPGPAGSTGGIWAEGGGGGANLVISAPSVVTAAPYAFVAGDVGRTIVILAGTGFTPGSYTVLSASGGAATLSSSPGTVGSTGGTWIEGGVSASDMVIIPPMTVSAAYTFVSGDIGKTVTITAGTGFTLGSYTIVSVAAGVATLSASPGTAGSTGGTWSDGTTSGTMLAIGPANEVTSASYSWGAADVGAVITVTGGTGFTPGTYTVTAGDVSATLSASPGLQGSAGGVWSETPINGTDLVIAPPVTVASASYVFSAIDVGGTLTITSGTGFTPGPYTILSTSNGVATLSSSPGTTGSTGGVWAEGTPFDPLYFGAKSGYADLLAGISVQNRNIWLIGAQSSSEIWFDAGSSDFPFQILPGPFIERGTIATYSIAHIGGSTFWLMQDATGSSIVVEGKDYAAVRVSNPAIEAMLAKCGDLTGAIGFCYEQQGHSFYWLKLANPAPNLAADWLYDISTQQWHERDWLNPNTCGEESHRAYCAAFAYGINIVGDRETGQLYMLDPNNQTDAGNFIERRRGYPHMMVEGARASFPAFTADVQPATANTVSTFGANIPPGLASPLDFLNVVVVIDTTFAAPNGTLLQNYFLPYALDAGDLGSQYTQIAPSINLVVESDMVTGGSVGTASYLASGVPTSPDYIAQFQMAPNSYGSVAPSGKQVSLTARANAFERGYQMMVSSDGTNYDLTLSIMGAAASDLVIHAANAVTSASYPFGPSDVGRTITITSGAGFTPGSYTVLSTSGGAATLSSSPGTAGSISGVWAESPIGTTTVVMGTLTSGYYQMFLSLQGSAIMVAVQRSQDAMWLTSGGAWQDDFAVAISITDVNYLTTGNVVIGGIW